MFINIYPHFRMSSARSKTSRQLPSVTSLTNHMHKITEPLVPSHTHNPVRGKNYRHTTLDSHQGSSCTGQGGRHTRSQHDRTLNTGCCMRLDDRTSKQLCCHRTALAHNRYRKLRDHSKKFHHTKRENRKGSNRGPCRCRRRMCCRRHSCCLNKGLMVVVVECKKSNPHLRMY